MRFQLSITITLAIFIFTSNAISTFFDTSVPSNSSVVVPGQDIETINPDRNSASLVAVLCKKRHSARAALKYAKYACDRLKKLDPWVVGPVGWFHTYPVVYPIRQPEDGFDVIGNPYYMYPMFKPLLAPPGGHTDHVLINEHCQLVGAVMWGKITKPGKRKFKFLNLFRKSPKGFKKCVVEMTRP